MAERERRRTPPYGGVFSARTRVMEAEDIKRATWRMAHEIIERNHGLDDLVVVGLQTGGVWLAAEIADALNEIEGVQPPLGTLDVAFHRDDIGLRPLLPEAPTQIPFNLDNQAVVIVDDVDGDCPVGLAARLADKRTVWVVADPDEAAGLRRRLRDDLKQDVVAIELGQPRPQDRVDGQPVPEWLTRLSLGTLGLSVVALAGSLILLVLW